MKINISCDRFTKECGLLAKVISKKIEPPVLRNLRVMGEDSCIALTVFTGTLRLSAVLECEVDDPDTYLIPCTALLEILRLLDKEEELNLEFTDDEKLGIECVITTSKGEYRIACDREQYPQLPSLEADYAEYVMDTANFMEAVEFSGNFTEKTKLDDIFSAILLESDGEDLLASISCDRHRLSVVNLDNKQKNQAFRFNLPGTFLSDQKQIFRGVEIGQKYVADNLVLRCDAQSLYCIEIGHREIIGSSMSQSYPDCRKLIPESFKGHFSVNRKDLITCLGLAQKTCDEHNHVAFHLNESEGKVTIVSRSATGASKQSLPIEQAFNCCDLTFDVRYLLQIASACQGVDLIIKMNSFNSLVLVQGLEFPAQFAYIMPMHPRG